MTIYLPNHFKNDNAAQALQVVDQYPFATLISVVGNEPFISHCPIMITPSDAGPILEGHVARANAHHQHWLVNAATLAIFQGPNAYISPTVYSRVENVPTWNYIAVHVHGQIRAIDGEGDKHALLKRLIAKLEPSYKAQWDGLNPAYQSRMLGAIVGFQIRIERIEAKFKLSQNRLPEDKRGVLAAMRSGGAQHRELAAWMEQLGVGV